MKINEKFYSYKNTQYDSEFRRCVEETCQYCIDNADISSSGRDKNPIMMLGKIQSGKTRAFTGLIALAFDNQFDMVFVLTKNSKALAQQTVKRMKSEFQPFIKNRSLNVSDILTLGDKFSGFQLAQKNIIIAKKQQNNLDKIIQFIEKYCISENKRCLIIDDEADTTGIGFEKKKGTDEFTLRTVSNKVNELRGTLDGCVFVEVTATPYALYLQPEFDDSAPLHPIKPNKTILVPHGQDYVGGKYYFIDSQENEHPASLIFEAVSDEEGELISDSKIGSKKSKINDRRSFKIEDILSREDQMVKFKDGIINFIMGVITLNALDSKSGGVSNECYSYVVHTSIGKSAHFTCEQIVTTFLAKIKEREDQAVIDRLLSKGYSSLQASVERNGMEMPEYEEVYKEFFRYIDQEYYSIDVVNTDNQVESLLDDDTGELYMKTPCSIFIGGQILDRGVTIPNMIGFYYGRNPRTMQQDTVLQHSRMFGYRKNFIPVTRFYTTERIYNNMVKITEMDEELRANIEKGSSGEGIYFITTKKQEEKFGVGDIKPCAPAKISTSDIIMLKPHKRILPIGFSPVIKTKYSSLEGQIEKILMNCKSGAEIELDLKTAIDLIEKIYGTIEDDGVGKFVTSAEFIMTLKYMANSTGKVNVIVYRNRNIKKYRMNGNLMDTPYDGNKELPRARELALERASIMLFQESGEDESWKGRQFWWPVLIAPRDLPSTVFASKVAGEVVTTKGE